MGAAVRKPPADTLYDEVLELARSIVEARKQIGSLRPSKLKTQSISKALLEMEEIVKTTEEASNTIMDSAEKMRAAEASDPGYPDIVQSNCSKIFEACAFQDLTGQRIGSVIQTLGLVDSHLEDLLKLLGPDFEEIEDETDDREGDDMLLNGPALEGEGISQDDIDKLFD